MRFATPTSGRAAAAALLALGAFLSVPAAAQSLRGSARSVSRMHHYAVRHGLRFYHSSRDVRRAVRDDRFVRLSGNADYRLHDVSFPYVRPAARTFVERLAADYRRACGERLVITSALRPTTRQPENASARSVHPTGIAVDIRRPTGHCLVWLRGTLRALEQRRVIEATEEHAPAHFHVAVFGDRYLPYVARLEGGSEVLASSGEASGR